MSVGEYRGEKVVIRFDGEKCIHSRFCVLERPDVFKANVEGPWIHPDDAPSAEALIEVAHRCPSGAITYERLDGGASETAPAVNLVRILENGPLAMRAALQIEGAAPTYRATLCRCGASKNKPFCDGSHSAAGFAATGEPSPEGDSVTLEARDGELDIKLCKNGPLLVNGNMELIAGTGHRVMTLKKAALCRCGASKNKPFCDGSHKEAGFEADGSIG